MLLQKTIPSSQLPQPPATRPCGDPTPFSDLLVNLHHYVHTCCTVETPNIHITEYKSFFKLAIITCFLMPPQFSCQILAHPVPEYRPWTEIRQGLGKNC